MKCPLKKCFFLVEQRSGSYLLADMLCLFDKSIYNKTNLYFKHDLVDNNIPLSTYENILFYVEIANLESYLLSHFFNTFNISLTEYLINANYQFVYLSRKNLLKQSISFAQAVKSQYWHNRSPELYVEKLIIDENDVIEAKKHLCRLRTYAEDLFSQYQINPHRIYYEQFDDVEKRQKFYQDMKTHIGYDFPYKVENVSYKKLAGISTEKLYESINEQSN